MKQYTKEDASNDSSDTERYYMWNEADYEKGESLAEQNVSEKGKDESMRYLDTYTQSKDARRKKLARDDQYDRFSDRVKERKVKKPRIKNIRYYDNEWNE